MERAGIDLNGVRYRWPSRPVVVVCIDGGDPAYFEQGVRDGVVPNVARFMKRGFAAVAQGDMPSFTCPNNMSITTGAPPAGSTTILSPAPATRSSGPDPTDP